MADRINYNSMQRKAMLSNADCAVRQAEALERIAAVLEDMYAKMYPVPAESAQVESNLPEVAPVEFGYETPEPPMDKLPMQEELENKDESGETSEV